MENEKSIGQCDASFYNELGDLYYQQGDKGRAEAAYRQAVHLDPNHGQAHMHLGDLATEADQWETAIAEYTQALKTLPSFCPLHINLGNAYLNLDRPAEAFRCYRQALKAMRGQDREWYRDHIVSMLIEAKKRMAKKPSGEIEGADQRPEKRLILALWGGDKTAGWIFQKSGLSRETVLKVLKVEEDYLGLRALCDDDQLRAETIALETQIPLAIVEDIFRWRNEFLVHIGLARYEPEGGEDGPPTGRVRQ